MGVVPRVRCNSPDYPQRPFQAYFPYAQNTTNFEILMLRTTGDSGALVSAVHKMIASVDPSVPVAKISMMEESVSKIFATRRLTVLLISLFSGVSLFLSAIGLYGILAHSVTGRTREIAIRIALGARFEHILGLVMIRGLRIVCTGLAIGIAVALVIARFIQSILYGVSAFDPMIIALAVAVLSLTGMLACLLPALHATRIGPATALRE